MPSRVVRGEILSSDSLSRVSRDAEALFWRLLIAADDFGRLDGRLGVLRAVLWPAREDICPGELQRWLQELCTCDPDGSGPVERFEVDGRMYLQLRSWEKHRSTSKRAEKSRFPAPPENPRESPGDPRGSADPRPSDECRVTSDECRVARAPSGAAVHAAAPSAPEPDRLPEEAPTREQAKAAKAKLEADVNRALNVLLDQQGGLDEKRLWLRGNLRGCEEWAKANGKPFRAALLSWWRNYTGKPDRPYREQARKAADKAALHEQYRQQGIDPYEPHGVPDVPKEMLEAAMANVISFGGRR